MKNISLFMFAIFIHIDCVSYFLGIHKSLSVVFLFVALFLISSNFCCVVTYGSLVVFLPGKWLDPKVFVLWSPVEELIF